MIEISDKEFDHTDADCLIKKNYCKNQDNNIYNIDNIDIKELLFCT